MKFCFAIIFSYSQFLSVFAQYRLDNSIVVMQDERVLLNPSTGGFNAPQFSSIDVDLDGKKDLFVFDRAGNKISIFLNTSTDEEIEFSYAPEYENKFPPVKDWALLRDYNCDGREDIFTYYSGTTSVYKAIFTDSVLSFELAEDKLTYEDDFIIPVYTSRSDLPEFRDINNDGDIDVLSFGTTGTTIRYFENNSQENGWACDSLKYELTDYCWGMLNEGFTCSGAELGISCKGFDNSEDLKMHVGSTVLVFDKDGDFDKDLLLGDISCTNLVYYKNGGDEFSAEMISKDTLFPSNTLPAQFHEYLSSALVDLNNDGDEDLLVSSNDDQFGLNADNIWYYENLNTNDTSDFLFIKNNFLLDNTIDVGNNSKPCFADFNKDNLIDLFIGSGYFYGDGDLKQYGLWYFQNTGTADAPSFNLTDRNFANTGEYEIENIFPAFIDIDADADNDLLIGSSDGTITLFNNESGTWAVPQFNYQTIDVGSFSTPAVFDINQDGLQDLIIGEQNGNLNFYQNTGSASSPIFTLISENFGGVDVREPGYATGFSTPCIYKNEHDSILLLSGAELGKIHLYDDIEESLSGEFHQRDTMFLNYLSGYYSSVSNADINNDGHQDFVLGNQRGGIHFFMYDESVQFIEIKEQLFSIYPNPVYDYLTIQYDTQKRPVSIVIWNILGEQNMQFPINQTQINLAQLDPGIYFLELQFDQQERSIRMFIKQ